MSFAENFSTYTLPVEAIDPKFRPVVTTVQRQSDGSYFVGLLFAKPAFLKIHVEDGAVVEAIDQEIEKSFDQDFLGIVGGLRGNRTGDTAFVTLHRGSSPLFGMFKKTNPPQTQEELFLDLAHNGNALGFSYKHSYVQIIDHKIQVRSSKQGGALLDAALIGDFIFGLDGGVIFREPYLNAEKRYFLREDLEANFRLHKVHDGVFWLLGADQRLMKLNLQDNKALPTTKRVPGTPFRASENSEVDAWLYGVAGNSFFRVRVNVENKLDELQEIKKFEKGLPLSVVSAEILEKASKKKAKEKDEDTQTTTQTLRKGRVWVSVDEDGQAALYEIPTESQEDPELLPDAPMPEKVFATDLFSNFNNLSVMDNEILLGSCQLKDGKVAIALAKI